MAKAYTDLKVSYKMSVQDDKTVVRLERIKVMWCWF